MQHPPSWLLSESIFKAMHVKNGLERLSATSVSVVIFYILTSSVNLFVNTVPIYKLLKCIISAVVYLLVKETVLNPNESIREI